MEIPTPTVFSHRLARLALIALTLLVGIPQSRLGQSLLGQPLLGGEPSDVPSATLKVLPQTIHTSPRYPAELTVLLVQPDGTALDVTSLSLIHI